MAKIVLKNVMKQYDNNNSVLNDFSFESQEDEFVVIVGPSGCGKSTLLLSIAGLEPINGGAIYIDNTDITALSPKSRNVSMVFQNYALYPHMTVYDNLAFPLKLRKVHKKEIQERVLKVAEMLELTKELPRKPKTLSGGQRQRVAIGRAIIREPKVFLFDEPLSNLDAALKESTRAEIKRLHQRLNAVFIYVTHDQMEAMTLGERIIVMNDGTIQQIDTPKKLYIDPKNYFVARFIGSPAINTISSKLASSMARVEYPDTYIYCVRPEHIMLQKDAGGIAEITDIELLGKEIHIKLLFEKEERFLACEICDPDAITYQKGDRVNCIVNKEKILAFSPKDGERVMDPFQVTDD